MNIVQIAQQHYASQGTKTLTIPEWKDGDKPCEIHYKPFTAADYEKIDKLVGKNSTAYRQDVATLIVKALDAEGKRLFKGHDIDELMMVDKAPIYNAVLEMVTAQRKMEDDIAKN